MTDLNAATQLEVVREHEKFIYEFKEKMKDFDNGIDSARAVGREAVYKIVLLSASIVGFSATIQSIEGLRLNTDAYYLKLSWLLFVVVVAMGPLMSILESRAKYVIAWRSLQAQDNWLKELGFWRKIQAVPVIFYSITISPRNLIFCRQYKDEKAKKLRARQNGMVIALTNWFFNIVLFLEIVFILLFICALITLILSVGI